MWLWTLAVAIIVGWLVNTQVESCDEYFCGSVVSKCLLLKRCSCETTNHSCLAHCYHCLGDFYVDCCSCLRMCPEINHSASPISNQSNVEDFSESVPALFQILTDYPDPSNRWTSHSFPINLDTTPFAPKTGMKLYMESNDEKLQPLNSTAITVNCSVAYIAHCMSLAKCRKTCKSMGASSCRWFHDGCCECVGDTCINYGKNESKCGQCPSKEETNIDEDVEDQDADYGDGNEFNDDFDTIPAVAVGV